MDAPPNPDSRRLVLVGRLALGRLGRMCARRHLHDHALVYFLFRTHARTAGLGRRRSGNSGTQRAATSNPNDGRELAQQSPCVSRICSARPLSGPDRPGLAVSPISGSHWTGREHQGAGEPSTAPRDHAGHRACPHRRGARPSGTIGTLRMIDEQTAEPRLRDALDAFRHANGLSPDEATHLKWSCHIGPLKLTLPNFTWRQKAIVAHDLHHVLIGYPCNLFGECQMAAWEFGAGRMPHWAATAFCLPLALAGLVRSPAAILRAWRRGRRGRSLHGTSISAQLLELPLSAARLYVTRGTQAPMPDLSCASTADTRAAARRGRG